MTENATTSARAADRYTRTNATVAPGVRSRSGGSTRGFSKRELTRPTIPSTSCEVLVSVATCGAQTCASQRAAQCYRDRAAPLRSRARSSRCRTLSGPRVVLGAPTTEDKTSRGHEGAIRQRQGDILGSGARLCRNSFWFQPGGSHRESPDVCAAPWTSVATCIASEVSKRSSFEVPSHSGPPRLRRRRKGIEIRDERGRRRPKRFRPSPGEWSAKPGAFTNTCNPSRKASLGTEAHESVQPGRVFVAPKCGPAG